MQKPSQSEREQRVRIGLMGLAGVFLLVLIGTAVSRSGDQPAARPGNSIGLTNSSEPDEPLAQIGVAPGQTTTENSDSGAARRP